MANDGKLRVKNVILGSGTKWIEQNSHTHSEQRANNKFKWEEEKIEKSLKFRTCSVTEQTNDVTYLSHFSPTSPSLQSFLSLSFYPIIFG